MAHFYAIWGANIFETFCDTFILPKTCYYLNGISFTYHVIPPFKFLFIFFVEFMFFYKILYHLILKKSLNSFVYVKQPLLTQRPPTYVPYSTPSFFNSSTQSFAPCT
jgi:predicted neutral ceramidase superfamily lipid hydrolase